MPSEMWHEATQGSTQGQINKYTWEEQNHTWAPCMLETAPIFFLPLFAPGPVTPFGSKPAGQLSSF